MCLCRVVSSSLLLCQHLSRVWRVTRSGARTPGMACHSHGEPQTQDLRTLIGFISLYPCIQYTCLTMGHGLFKPNITVIIGCLSVYFICCWYRKLPSDNLHWSKNSHSKMQLNRAGLEKTGKELNILRKTLPWTCAEHIENVYYRKCLLKGRDVLFLYRPFVHPPIFLFVCMYTHADVWCAM